MSYASKENYNLWFIKGGKSDYRIILPQESSSCERYAADFLKERIERCTGANLSICSEAEDTGKYGLHIGRCKGSRYDGNAPDGFTLTVTDDCNLWIRGGSDRGTLYGVYDFLEKFLGVRFIAADEEIDPFSKEVRIAGGYTSEPDFRIRSFYTVQTEKNAAFASKLRQLPMWGEERAELGFGVERDGLLVPHNVFEYVDHKKYGAAHPEFFYSWVSEEDPSVTGYDLCFSNGIDEDGNLTEEEESAARIAAQSLLNKVIENPDRYYFAICQNDVPTGCPCETCRRRREKIGYSGIVVQFVNAVARWVREELKKRKISREFAVVTFAYAYSVEPPLSEKGEVLVSADDDVVIWLATAEQNFFYACGEAGQEIKWTKQIVGWKKAAKRFAYWDYRINFVEFFWYVPGLFNLGDDFRYLKKMNVEYLFCEASTGSLEDPDIWLNDLRGYVASKLMWDTGLNTEQLIKEYLHYYYGRHAKGVWQMLSLLEKNNERLKKDPTRRARFNHMLGYRSLESDYYPAKMLLKIVGILQKEIAAAEGRYKKRLKAVMLTPQRMLLRNWYDYFPKDTEGRKKMYEELFSALEELQIDMLGIAGFTKEAARENPDYNWWKQNGILY